MPAEAVDVLICGAGPVGLVLAIHLRQLGISVCIVDAANKAEPSFPMYGRACALYPRSCEILDQLNLFDDLAQEGFVTNEIFHYKNGERAKQENVLKDAADTSFCDITLFLRLKYIEDIFRKRLEELNVVVRAPAKLVNFEVDREAKDDYQVTVSLEHPGSRETSSELKCKYLIGADGGRSTVRRLSQIPFGGPRKAEVDHWVRIDGIVKTNLPEARLGLGSFESETHGHVLWAALDRSATRIGYCLTQEMYQRYGMHMSAEDAALEAAKAVAPFQLEFTQIDWHTVYGIHQNVAARYKEGERVFLAGDAAHTHSSGSAQGMNTGIHDAASLSWRLAGVLQGRYNSNILENYSEERLAIAREVIENDKILSKLVAGQVPEYFSNSSKHPYELLDDFKAKISTFTTGLGITYPPNLLNFSSESSGTRSLKPGHRVPDVLVQKPGIYRARSRLFEIMKNEGKFRIVVYSGRPHHTASDLQTLRSSVDRSTRDLEHGVEFFTIVPDGGHALDEHLGLKCFGRGYWDPDCSAHAACSISLHTGAVLVIRPDGILGLITTLSRFDLVTRYLRHIVLPKSLKSPVDIVVDRTPKSLGEFVIHNESSLLF